MEQYLIVNDLWDVVTGTGAEPTETSEKAEFCWKQKSARARVGQHVSTSQLNTVRLEIDPKWIWDELQCLNRPWRLQHMHGTSPRVCKDTENPGMPTTVIWA